MESVRLHSAMRVARVAAWISCGLSVMGLLAMSGGPANANPLFLVVVLGFLLPPMLLAGIFGVMLRVWVATWRNPDGEAQRSWRPLGVAAAAMILSLFLWPYMASSGRRRPQDVADAVLLGDTHRAVAIQLERWQRETPRMSAHEIETRLARTLQEEAARQKPGAAGFGLSSRIHRVEGAVNWAAMDARVRSLATEPGRVVFAFQPSAADHPGFMMSAVRLRDPKEPPCILTRAETFGFPFGAR